MDFFKSMLPFIMIGMTVLIVGALLVRDSEKNLSSSIMEGLGWAIGFFVAFSTEILVIGSL